MKLFNDVGCIVNQIFDLGILTGILHSRGKSPEVGNYILKYHFTLSGNASALQCLQYIGPMFMGMLQ